MLTIVFNIGEQNRRAVDFILRNPYEHLSALTLPSPCLSFLCICLSTVNKWKILRSLYFMEFLRNATNGHNVGIIPHLWFLKGQLHEIFALWFFFIKPDSRPKAVSHMASYLLRKWIIFEFQWCQWHRWNYFSRVIDTAETISAVPLTPLKRFQVCRFALLKPILATFKAIILANTMPYAKRV
jgi:hypothetical protein